MSSFLGKGATPLPLGAAPPFLLFCHLSISLFFLADSRRVFPAFPHLNVNKHLRLPSVVVGRLVPHPFQCRGFPVTRDTKYPMLSLHTVDQLYLLPISCTWYNSSSLYCTIEIMDHYSLWQPPVAHADCSCQTADRPRPLCRSVPPGGPRPASCRTSFTSTFTIHICSKSFNIDWSYSSR